MWGHPLVCKRRQRITAVSFKRVKDENIPVENTSEWGGLVPTRLENAFKAHTGQVDELVEKMCTDCPLLNGLSLIDAG